MEGVDRIRAVLSGHTIDFEKRQDEIRIFDHVDAFVDLSRGNESVEKVSFCLATESILLATMPPGPTGMSSGTKLLKALESFRHSVRSQLWIHILLWWAKMTRLSLTGRFWLAPCGVFGGVSSYVCGTKMHYSGIQQLCQFLLE
jgi:hypothetical protein